MYKSCRKSCEKSCCDDCSNKKRCKECNILKTDFFYKYKNGKLYSTCIECFNKKVKCEFCNKVFNRTYLSKHIKRFPIEKMHLNDNKIINNIHNNIHNNENHNNENHKNENHNNENHNDENHKDENHNDESNNDNIMFNRTLIVGRSFCGKTQLLLNKLQLIRLDIPEQKIRIITRSPEQYSNIEIEDTEDQQSCISEEEDLEDRTIHDFQKCCVVFDDMLDSNQKLIDPFF